MSLNFLSLNFLSFRFWAQCLAVLGLIASPLFAWAQPPELVMAVNEGVTYRITAPETRQRYRALAELISVAIKRPVTIVALDSYATLRAGLNEKKYDLAFIHPAHHSLNAIHNQQYQLLAVTQGYTHYTVSFLVPGNSPLQKAQDLQGKALVMPDADSITSVMARATLRDLKLDKVSVHNTRFQDAVPFYIEKGFTQAGATASTAVVRAWHAQQGRTLFESRSMPIKHWIASPYLSGSEVSKIREVLLSLSTHLAGRSVLETLGFKGFETYPEAQLDELSRWLGV